MVVSAHKKVEADHDLYSIGKNALSFSEKIHFGNWKKAKWFLKWSLFLV
jgi:hypothetical protein